MCQADSLPPCLQISKCSIHHSGALLLEPRDGLLLDGNLNCIAPAAGMQAQPGAQPTAGLAASLKGSNFVLAAAWHVQPGTQPTVGALHILHCAGSASASLAMEATAPAPMSPIASPSQPMPPTSAKTKAASGQL